MITFTIDQCLNLLWMTVIFGLSQSQNIDDQNDEVNDVFARNMPDVSNLKWFHDIGRIKHLNDTTHSIKQIVVVDIIADNQSNAAVPFVKHRRNIPLRDFLKIVASYNVGLKMNFEDFEIIETSLQLLSPYKDKFNDSLWLAAAVLPGPGKFHMKFKLVNAFKFIDLCRIYFPKSVIVLGWSGFYEQSGPGNVLQYSWTNILSMLDIVQMKRLQSFVIQVDAYFAMRSIPQLWFLLSILPESILLLNMTNNSSVSVVELYNFRSNFDPNRIAYDLPKFLLDSISKIKDNLTYNYYKFDTLPNIWLNAWKTESKGEKILKNNDTIIFTSNEAQLNNKKAFPPHSSKIELSGRLSISSNSGAMLRFNLPSNITAFINLWPNIGFSLSVWNYVGNFPNIRLFSVNFSIVIHYRNTSADFTMTVKQEEDSFSKSVHLTFFYKIPFVRTNLLEVGEHFPQKRGIYINIVAKKKYIVLENLKIKDLLSGNDDKITLNSDIKNKKDLNINLKHKIGNKQRYSSQLPLNKKIKNYDTISPKKSKINLNHKNKAQHINSSNNHDKIYKNNASKLQSLNNNKAITKLLKFNSTKFSIIKTNPNEMDNRLNRVKRSGDNFSIRPIPDFEDIKSSLFTKVKMGNRENDEALVLNSLNYNREMDPLLKLKEREKLITSEKEKNISTLNDSILKIRYVNIDNTYLVNKDNREKSKNNNSKRFKQSRDNFSIRPILDFEDLTSSLFTKVKMGIREKDKALVLNSKNYNAEMDPLLELKEREKPTTSEKGKNISTLKDSTLKLDVNKNNRYLVNKDIREKSKNNSGKRVKRSIIRPIPDLFIEAKMEKREKEALVFNSLNYNTEKDPLLKLKEREKPSKSENENNISTLKDSTLKVRERNKHNKSLVNKDNTEKSKNNNDTFKFFQLKSNEDLGHLTENDKTITTTTIAPIINAIKYSKYGKSDTEEPEKDLPRLPDVNRLLPTSTSNRKLKSVKIFYTPKWNDFLFHRNKFNMK